MEGRQPRRTDSAATTQASAPTGAASPKGGKTYEVEIAGVPLRLKSSHDEQTVQELVELVDAKVREALRLSKSGSIQNASILASLHLAEEYLMLKRQTKTELDQLEARAQKVLTELESSRISQVGPSNS